MDLWIIQDGEKVGPLHDFEVRKRIEEGQLPGSTPAWHEGLANWQTLAQISLFAGEFERQKTVVERPPVMPTPAEAPARVVPPPLPGSPALIRRFWARWFDLYLFGGVWWLLMWASGRHIEAALTNGWMILFQYAPWFLLEVWLLHRFGTTPGKWLLGLRVRNDDGSPLSLTQSARRALRVWIVGMGFGFAGLTLICQMIAYYTGMRFGRPFWDQAGGHRVVVGPVNPLRIVGYVVALYLALQLQMIVIAPYVFPEVLKATERYPTLHQQLENNPPWHLPPRH